MGLLTIVACHHRQETEQRSRGYSPSRSIAKPDINSRSTNSASPQAAIILVNSRPYTAGDKSTEMNATDCSLEHLCSNSTALYEDYAFIGDLIKVLAIVMLLITCPGSGYPSERTRYCGDQNQTKASN